MGKSAPSAPSPSATASAQTTLSDVNQYTPFGNLTYQQTGTVNGVPQMSATTTLSPQEQSLFNGQMSQDQSLLQPENSLLNQISSNYGGASYGAGLGADNGFTPSSGYSSQPGMASAQGYGKASTPSQPSASASSVGASSSPNIVGSPAQSFGGEQNPNTFSPVSGGMSNGQLNNWMGSFQDSAGPSSQAGTQYANNQGYSAQQTGAAPLAQAQMAGVSQAQGGQIQNQLSEQNLQGAFNQQQQSAYNSQMAYLQPQEQQQTAQLQDQLAQQGITQESNPTAYANAMTLNNNNQTFNNQQAYNNSYQSGLAGANQLFNQGLQSDQFTNAAQQQGFNESATNAGYLNTAALQNSNLGTQANLQNASLQNSDQQLNANLGSQASQFGANAYNTAALQNASMGNTNNMFNAGQANSMAQANASLNNTALNSQMAGFGENSGLNNSANQQQWGNYYNAQNQPISQLNALRGMNAITNPSFDSSGSSAANSYANSVQQQYASQLGSYNNSQSGLYGLGGAALMAYAMA